MQSAFSKTESEPQRRRPYRTPSLRHTQAHFATIATCCNRLPFGLLCSFFPRAKNCAFIFLTRTQVRLFLTWGSPCVCSTSDCAVLLRSRHTKRSDIMSERYLLCECCKERSDGIAIVTLCVNRVELSPATRLPWVPLQGGTAIWARRVKQFVQWTDCSQSEQGGLPRKRRSPNG